MVIDKHKVEQIDITFGCGEYEDALEHCTQVGPLPLYNFSIQSKPFIHSSYFLLFSIIDIKHFLNLPITIISIEFQSLLQINKVEAQ